MVQVATDTVIKEDETERSRQTLTKTIFIKT